VEPAELAKTPLGRCLQMIGKKARFPASGAQESFAVEVAP
jgi:hypothetical protein